jgi:hypothetical protein
MVTDTIRASRKVTSVVMALAAKHETPANLGSFISIAPAAVAAGRHGVRCRAVILPE